MTSRGSKLVEKALLQLKKSSSYTGKNEYDLLIGPLEKSVGQCSDKVLDSRENENDTNMKNEDVENCDRKIVDVLCNKNYIEEEKDITKEGTNDYEILTTIEDKINVKYSNGNGPNVPSSSNTDELNVCLNDTNKSTDYHLLPESGKVVKETSKAVDEKTVSGSWELQTSGDTNYDRNIVDVLCKTNNIEEEKVITKGGTIDYGILTTIEDKIKVESSNGNGPNKCSNTDELDVCLNDKNKSTDYHLLPESGKVVKETSKAKAVDEKPVSGIWELETSGDTRILLKRKVCENQQTITTYSSDSDIIDDTDSDPDYDYRNERSRGKRFCFLDLRNVKRYEKIKHRPISELVQPSCSGISYTKKDHLKDSGLVNQVTNDSNECSVSNTDVQDSVVVETLTVKQKTKKKRAQPSEWLKTQAKNKRNLGQKYVSSTKSKKEVAAKSVRPPCGIKCRLKCTTKISEEQRLLMFSKFWALGDVTRQRDFISKCIQDLEPKYRYPKENTKRRFNKAFYFNVGQSRIRVCKYYFTSTLDIPNRYIRTVVDKMENGFLQEDRRGKHSNHKTVNPEIRSGIRNHINSIPRVESHYLRQQTSREFIEGGKNLSDLYRDYKEDCIKNNQPHGNYTMYSRIFHFEYNISFFQPKKDQCDVCTGYELANVEEKANLKENYDFHLKEKELSRIEKLEDKTKINKSFIVACYDLQAVFSVPKGEVSQFYYKSKLNCFNFTICELKRNVCENSDLLKGKEKIDKNIKKKEEVNQLVYCFTWHEAEGCRGVNELGSCVFRYLKEKSEAVNDPNFEIVLYSDNCGGQQKNRFMIAMYTYAVSVLKIKAITHKFLVKGHTQNEGDTAHSIVEKATKKALKSGPVYVPSQFFSIIRSSKKTGKPFQVREMCYKDFYDLKQLYEDCGYKRQIKKKVPQKIVKRQMKQEEKKIPDGEDVSEDDDFMMSKAHIIRVEKSNPLVIFYKNSYGEKEFKKRKIEQKRKHEHSISNVTLSHAYEHRIKLGERKKDDIMSLINANLIPEYYKDFYINL